MMNNLPIDAELRHQIRESGISLNRLAKESGCTRRWLSAFMNEHHGISTRNMERLTGALGKRIEFVDIDRECKEAPR